MAPTSPPAKGQDEAYPLGKNNKNNARKREKAKQRKAEAKAKVVYENEVTDKLSALSFEVREPESKSDGVDDGASGVRGQSRKDVPFQMIPVPKEALFEIKYCPQKGYGIFASKTIKKGTEILREEGIFYARESWLEAHAMFSLLSDVKKSQVMALHGACHCIESDSPCGETILMQIWETNNWLIRIDEKRFEPPEGAVYLLASRINHDCSPNTRLEFTDDFEIVFEAQRDIPGGEEITTSYVDPRHFPSNVARREALLKNYKFACGCLSCIHQVDLSRPTLALEMTSQQHLPVLGKHTTAEKRAFAEARLWVTGIVPKVNKVLADVQLSLEFIQRSYATGNCQMSPQILLAHKFELYKEVLAANDEYNLGSEIIEICFVDFREFAQNQVLEEWDRLVEIMEGLET